MGTFRDISIDRKLIVIIMVTTAVSMLLSGIGIFICDAILFRRYMGRDLTALASIVADNTTAALVFDDRDSAEETLASLRERSHIMKACIYRADGTELARYERAGSPAGCPPVTAGASMRFTGMDVTVWRPILLDERRVGTLGLFYDLGELYERGQLYGLIVLGVPLAASLLGLLLSSRLRALVTTPISNLARVAARVSGTRDYGIRAEKQSGDELGVLVDSFNEMLNAIQFRDNELLKALLDREQALKEAGSARDSLKTTLASIGEAVISTDLGGRVSFANRVAQSLLKTPEPELAGKYLDDVFVTVSEGSPQRLENPVQEVLEGRVTGIFDHTVLVAPDGTETPIDFSGAPIRSDDGAMHGTVLVFRDARARRSAEETSRLLAAIVESSDDGIIGEDLNGVITSWNLGAERIFGYSADEMIGCYDSVLAAPGHFDDMHEIPGRITRGKSLSQIQTVRCTKSGAMIDVWITVSPLHDASGRITGASKIARDITQQVRAANRLASLNTDLKHSNDSLARSNEDLERFAFVASHDLQEPLRMIAIFTQLLLKDYPTQPDGQTATYASHIVDGIQRMRDLLGDLLAYTEIGASADPPAEPVNLNVVIDKVRENLSATIAESGAIIAAQPLLILNVSESHFISLFQNLIGNAIKYRSECRPEIRIFMDRKEGHLNFTVADNGIGIDPQYHERIFLAFKRLHGKKIPGTGIGLAICQRVVERYGGTIRVESEPDRGAAFIITVPDILASGEIQ